VTAISLEQEQEELLKALVEASRNVPRDQREEFHHLTDGDGSSIMHPGLPERQMRVHDGDIHILEAEGLVLVTQIGRWHRSFVVTPQGSALYEEMQRRSGAPTQQVEETLMRYLDSDAFQRAHPAVYRKWAEAAELLWKSDSQQQLTTIGHLCREAMQAFATGLVDRHEPPGVDTDTAHDVARMRALLDQHRPRLGTTAAPFLDALLTYWGTVSDLVQRQEHGAQKEGHVLIWEDGRRVVFQSIVVMFEVDRALQPVDEA
jgi:hypothetical protein